VLTGNSAWDFYTYVEDFLLTLGRSCKYEGCSADRHDVPFFTTPWTKFAVKKLFVDGFTQVGLFKGFEETNKEDVGRGLGNSEKKNAFPVKRP